MIRKLEDRWMEQTIQLVKDYSIEIGFPDQFHRLHTGHKLNAMDVCFIYTIADDVAGLIGGSVYPSPWNPAITTFHEEIFYIAPSIRSKGVGRELMEAFMDEIDKRNYAMSTMKLMFNSPDIEELYKKHDYIKLETTYIRR